MKWLLDTMVISELRKKQPDQNVLDWLRSVPDKQLYPSVVTISEIQRGIAQQRSKDRLFSDQLQSWLDLLQRNYADCILPVTPEVACRWGNSLRQLGMTAATSSSLPLLCITVSPW